MSAPQENGASGNGAARKKRPPAIAIRRHLELIRATDLRDVHAFWMGGETPDLPKRELVDAVERSMADEGIVYRRVRTLTRKVLDVLLLLLRRDRYASDLPGLFRRLPGEEAVKLEYHEAEAGLKALYRRGFLAEVTDRSMATNGRVLYAVPEELGERLTSLFREETRTVAGVFSLREHVATITAAERQALRAAFPALEPAASPGDATAILGREGAPALLARLDAPLRAMVEHVVQRHGGLCLRSEWSARSVLKDVRWNRKDWAPALEAAGVGTVARLSLADYGIACDDEAVVVFREPLEDLLRRRDPAEPESDEVLRPGPDLVADLCAFVEHVRRAPLKLSRDGEVYKSGLKRIQEGFVFRESPLAGPQEVWGAVSSAARNMGLVGTDKEGFLEVRPEAERFLALELDAKAQELHRLALEQAGPAGRSLHQHELRTVVADCLRQEPGRWWTGRSLTAVARHRYLATLDERGIKDRHRDRYFSAYFSGRETPADLADHLLQGWLPRLFLLGLLDAALKDGRAVAWRLSTLGARVLGVAVPDLETGVKPLLVNPDFEVVVLPEGDVSDVVHTLDRFAQRVKSGDVVHFRLTKEAVEAAVAAGRPVDEFLRFLAARSRGGLPQNVAYTVRGWASSVSFATLERGIVLRAADEVALERFLAIPEMAALLLRRLSPSEVLLKEEPRDRRLLASLHDQGLYLQGP